MGERAQQPFSEVLPELLLARGMSLRALARQVGVSDAHLSRVLRGVGYRTRPSSELARRVAVALDLPGDFFVEVRETAVVDEVRRNAELRDRLFDELHLS
jgi:transcriptional regulator with XRE-family HTH domain